jgi:hypothetical protein
MHLRPLQARQLAIPPRLQCRQLAQPTPPMPLPPPVRVRSISAIAVPDDAQRQAETQVSREWIEVLGRCARMAPIHLAISGLRRQCAGPSDHRPAPTTKFHRKSGIDRGSSHDFFLAGAACAGREAARFSWILLVQLFTCILFIWRLEASLCTELPSCLSASPAARRILISAFV